ncbi:hypothetical protein [Fluviispira vulneris]|uniref:hypothetical protein n=1 Tax=Fluviispira vulneris TaxID=2763012 RepID=UPI00164917DB|nr:hypothetical protein [Fluviispira vulneris]
MKSIISEFEQILFKSLVYYPDNEKNIASTFKVTLPEIYYEKFKVLNERQKLIIATFVNKFLKKIQKSEAIDNESVKSHYLNFSIDKTKLLNKQNTIQFVLNEFEDCIDSYNDIKLFEDVHHRIRIENNTLANKNFPIFIGSYLDINQCGCMVIMKLNTRHQQKIVNFIKKYKVNALYFISKEEFDIYLTFHFFDGEFACFKNSTEEEKEKFKNQLN